jgi:hypothetical protein
MPEKRSRAVELDRRELEKAGQLVLTALSRFPHLDRPTLPISLLSWRQMKSKSSY